ncbi:uncharacterized protein LAJ45_05061 [Morchella importuna]|uniref:uncharacterized protein n=1 Tax=Morchella importuna TaxID=1174673 RepID=UPI001E8E662C|nr:uncharacterized protein LAJ45_05061 [Morchella importuna]KAH8150879.1 hypothetical protein LAJ45_05061 [Morchella importuna]
MEKACNWNDGLRNTGLEVLNKRLARKFFATTTTTIYILNSSAASLSISNYKNHLQLTGSTTTPNYQE